MLIAYAMAPLALGSCLVCGGEPEISKIMVSGWCLATAGLVVLASAIGMLRSWMAGLALGLVCVGVLGSIVYRHAERDRVRWAEMSHYFAISDPARTVCDGHAIAEAATLRERGPRPTVLFTEEIRRHDQAGAAHLGVEHDRLFPRELDALQIVACFQTVRQELGECEFQRGRQTVRLSRTRYRTHGILREAQTARVIVERWFESSEPEPCDGVVHDWTDLEGKVDIDALIRFVHEYADPRAYELAEPLPSAPSGTEAKAAS
jgi:hypothetical protein